MAVLVLANVLVSDSTTNNGAYVLMNNQQGGFTQVPTTIGGQSTQVILADLNNDGNLDLVTQFLGQGGVSVYLGNGAGGFTPHGGFIDPILLNGMDMVADLNGDGIPDIVVLEADTAAIHLGKGAATYESPFYIGTGPS